MAKQNKQNISLAIAIFHNHKKAAMKWVEWISECSSESGIRVDSERNL